MFFDGAIITLIRETNHLWVFYFCGDGRGVLGNEKYIYRMKSKDKQSRASFSKGLITISVITLLFCQIIQAQSLRIEIFNRTGYDLDSVYMDYNYVGSIKKDSSVLVLDCKEIVMDSGMPIGRPEGIIKNKVKTSEPQYLCGTEIYSVKEGDFKFDIKIMEEASNYRLYW
jgi:hypothetical protein